MRHLFVPACLCVMTWSNTTGFDLPIDKFSATPSFDKKIVTRTAKAQPTPRVLDEPPAAEPVLTGVAVTSDETP